MGLKRLEWRKKINSRGREALVLLKELGVVRDPTDNRLSTWLCKQQDDFQERIAARLCIECDEVRKLDEEGNPI